LTRLRETEPGEHLVASELHEDGSYHLHIFIRHGKQSIQRRNLGTIQKALGLAPDGNWYHPQKQDRQFAAALNVRISQTLRYCMKGGWWWADFDPTKYLLEDGDVPAKKEKGVKRRIADLVLTKLKEDPTANDGDLLLPLLDDPELAPCVMFNMSALQRSAAFYRRYRVTAANQWPEAGPQLVSFRLVLEHVVLVYAHHHHVWVRAIVDWLLNNVCCARKSDERALVIYSTTGQMKTAFADAVRRLCVVYNWVYGPYQDIPNEVRLILMDEFRGQMTATDMNLLLDGDYRPRPIYGEPQALPFRVPVMIFTNGHVNTWYEGMRERIRKREEGFQAEQQRLEALERRLHQVVLDEPNPEVFNNRYPISPERKALKRLTDTINILADRLGAVRKPHKFATHYSYDPEVVKMVDELWPKD